MTTKESIAEVPAADLPIIRQSFHCFYLGLFGLVPVAGMTIARQALRTFSEIQKVSEAKDGDRFPTILLLVGLLANPFVILGIGWPGWIVFTTMLCAIYVVWVWRQYSRARIVSWNPARNFAWAGAACARIGLAGSFLLLELLYVFSYSNLFFGTK